MNPEVDDKPTEKVFLSLRLPGNLKRQLDDFVHEQKRLRKLTREGAVIAAIEAMLSRATPAGARRLRDFANGQPLSEPDTTHHQAQPEREEFAMLAELLASGDERVCAAIRSNLSEFVRLIRKESEVRDILDQAEHQARSAGERIRELEKRLERIEAGIVGAGEPAETGEKRGRKKGRKAS